MKKRAYPLSKVYGLLETGTVVLVFTLGFDNRPNIMTMSWHTMIDFEPPLVGCVISDRNYTLRVLKRTRECAINIPTVELAKQVVACGNRSGRKFDKFILEVLNAWVNPGAKHPKTLHHQGDGVFRVAGNTIRLTSKKK